MSLENIRNIRCKARLAALLLVGTCGASGETYAQSINDILANPPAPPPASASNQAEVSYSYDSKESFLAAASRGDQWWQTWGFERYIPNNDFALYVRLKAKSETIREIIQASYKVKVPLDPLRAPFAVRRQAREYARSGKPLRDEAGNTWCGALTPYDLSSILAATTAIVAPELTWVGDNPEETKKHSISYIRYAFHVLESYCNPLDDGKFVSALKDFLDEYQRAILPQYKAELEAQARKRALEVAAKEDEARQEAERKRMEEIRLAAIEAARLKREQEIAAVRTRREEAADRSIAASRLAEEQRRSSIRSGVIPAKTISDIAIKVNAITGWEVVISPSVVPDKRPYDLSGRLVRKEGNVYVFEVRFSSDIRYFGARLSTQTAIDPDFTMRFESCTRVVGSYMDISQYSTVIGTARVLPIFSAIAVGSCR